jgi:diadenylate cyclase
MSVVTIHRGGEKHTLEPIPRVLARADQALQILTRYKTRLDAVSGSLSALEVEDLVTVRDVAAMLQRSETVRRVAEQIQTSIVELGAEAHLIRLQLDELLEDVDDDRELVLLDYLPDDKDERLESALLALASLSTDDLTELRTVAAVLLPGTEDETELIDLDHSLQPRGYRLLDKVPRLSEEVVDRLVERFGSLQKLTRATTADLSQVEGVDPSLALSVKDGLDRLAEHTLLDRFH